MENRYCSVPSGLLIVMRACIPFRRRAASSRTALPDGRDGVFSPDGTRSPTCSMGQYPYLAQLSRRHDPPLWIANLSDSRILDVVPRQNSNDNRPMWIGDKPTLLPTERIPSTLRLRHAQQDRPAVDPF
jgi:hypothetical protein